MGPTALSDNPFLLQAQNSTAKMTNFTEEAMRFLDEIGKIAQMVAEFAAVIAQVVLPMVAAFSG